MARFPSRWNAGFQRLLNIAPGLMVVAAAGAVTGCSSPVGNGVGPVSIALSPTTGTDVTAQGVTRVFQCFTGGIAAVLYFSNGTTGNFTNRVKWSSNNESAVKISNGEIAASDGSGFYPPGTLIPISVGNATITANFEGVVAQMEVSSGTSTGFIINQVVQSVPTAVPDTGVSLGTGTTRQFTVSAITDGVLRDVSAYAKWTVNGSVGTVSASGLVSALGAGGPSPLTASFLNCSNQVSAKLTVANISGIRIVPEFGNDPVLLNNVERIDVLADLDNGATQDVSTQATLTSTDSTIATLPIGIDGNNFLRPVAVGSVTVQAALNNTFNAPDRIVSIAQSTLTDFTVTPADDVLRAGSSAVGYFKATGSYLNGQTQDITRSVTWALLNTTLAAISNAKNTAGFAVPGSSLIGQTTVTATPPTTDSTASVGSATLTIDSVSNPATP